VLLTSSDNGVLTVPASVDVPAGQLTVLVAVTGVAAASATVSARLDIADLPVDASVRVLADDATATAVSIDPAAPTVVINRSQVFTVTFDVPTPTTGASLDLGLTGALGTLTASPLAVAANVQQATFTLNAGAAAATGTVTATLGATVTADVAVIELAPLGVVINEIDYDQDSTDGAEFIEVFNGTAAAVDLSGFDLVFVNGADKAVYRTVTLAGSIPQNGYLVVGPTAVAVPDGVVKINLDGTNLFQNGAPDAVLLFRAGDPDELVDAISYEGSLSGIAVRDQTVDLIGDFATDAADVDELAGSLCRDPTSGDWLFCAVQSAGRANTP
jgi:hypothetical protein